MLKQKTFKEEKDKYNELVEKANGAMLLIGYFFWW
jgi:D-Tyr-tRNAtyr deacylase